MGGAVALVVVLGLAGCTLDVSVDGTRFRCDDSRECPDGLSCVGGTCGSGDVEAGLIAYYPMDEDSEVTAMQPDVVGEHDAVCPEHCPNIGAGVISAAACFDGDDVLTIADDEALDLPSGAIAAWVNYQPGNRQAIVARPWLESDGTGNDDAWMLLVPGDDNAIWLELGGEPYTTAVETVADGQWVHVVGQWDDEGQAAIFVDGALRWSGSHVGVPAIAGPAYIGTDINEGAFVNGVTGCIDDLRIYDRRLSDGEIAALAERP